MIVALGLRDMIHIDFVRTHWTRASRRNLVEIPRIHARTRRPRVRVSHRTFAFLARNRSASGYRRHCPIIRFLKKAKIRTHNSQGP